MTPPFLAPKRLVLVENFLTRFTARDTGSRPQAAARDGRGEEDDGEAVVAAPPTRGDRALEAFEPVLAQIEANLPETTTLVFTLPPPEREAFARARRNAMVERIRKMPGAAIEDYPELKGEALLRHIREEAGLRGLRFRQGAPAGARPAEAGGRRVETDPVAALAAITQGDTLAIAGELGKLALYTMGRDATMDDVYAICSGEREARFWDFADAVMDGNLGVALELLPRLQAIYPADQAILAQLIGRYRTAAGVVDLLEAGAGREEIDRALGNVAKYDRLRDAALRRARRLAHGGLRQAWTAFVETDRAMKLGEIDDDLALELLVLRLCGESGARMAAH
jgi:hypothetical protein